MLSDFVPSLSAEVKSQMMCAQDSQSFTVVECVGFVGIGTRGRAAFSCTLLASEQLWEVCGMVL